MDAFREFKAAYERAVVIEEEEGEQRWATVEGNEKDKDGDGDGDESREGEIGAGGEGEIRRRIGARVREMERAVEVLMEKGKED